jgi:hypothetical protein
MIKLRTFAIVPIFMMWATTTFAQGMTETTGKDWMGSAKILRQVFVLGYVTGLEQLFSSFNWQLRSAAGKDFNAETLSEDLYKKLLNEPELRSGPVRESLMQVLSNYVVVTDRLGNEIPSWQRLMSTSDCAELIKRLNQAQPAKPSF